MDSAQSRRLPLHAIKFGKIDARNEVLTRDTATQQHFRESFLAPSGISLDEFITGERFFIYGMKGAGKTAFLRYIQLITEVDNCLTKFTSFASAISNEERDRILREAKIQIYEQDEVEVGQNAVSMWMIFIFRQLVQLIEENKKLFTGHQDIQLFCELVKRIHEGEGKTILTWLSGALKRGTYKLKTQFFDATVKGSPADVEKEYPIDIVVQQALFLLRSLSWEGKGNIYLFFDELNLAFGSRKQHRRDAILIRDLIVAIDQLNSFFVEQGKPIYLLAAARSEVLNALNVPTHEINKIFGDRGRELRWFSKTAGGEWPIIKLFEKKIHASEKIARFPVSRDVLDAYFDREIFKMTPKSLIIELTWCNPRDLILLFGRAAEAALGETYFIGNRLLSLVLGSFSAEAWREKIEELNVEYAAVEIHCIKKILLNFQRYFKMDQFAEEAGRKGQNDQNIKKFISQRNTAKVLEDLYRIGIIGQSSKRPLDTDQFLKQVIEHWAYRGDHNFDPTGWMVVHKALWPELRLGGLTPSDIEDARKPVVVEKVRHRNRPQSGDRR